MVNCKNNNSDLCKYELQFTSYANSFLTGNNDFDRNIILKREHSLKVMNECLLLASALCLPEQEQLLAGIAGLFHDVGRFEQFKRYLTFVDIKSENHGKLGGDVLKENFTFKNLSNDERNILLSAITNHNCRLLPTDLSFSEIIMAKIVRDADKLDIMRIVLDYYTDPEKNESIVLELDNSDIITKSVFDAVMKNVTVSIRDLRTVADFKIAQLAWIYDLNYQHSIERYVMFEYHHKLHKHLPETIEVEQIFSAVCKYLDNRIAHPV